LGPWIRYGQSKFANILFASELARRHPELTSVSLHPGFVMTPMNTEMVGWNKMFGSTLAWLTGNSKLQPDQGVLSQLWCATSAKKEELKNGGYYKPVGVESSGELTAEVRDQVLAKKLWDWTEKVLEGF
jgi:hypothetical protein